MPEGFSELVIQAFAVPWSLEVRAGREMNFYATIAPLLDEPGEDVAILLSECLWLIKRRGSDIR